MTTAIFPGSFDPFTEGHAAIARRIAPIFDRLIIAIGNNSDKHPHFTPQQRQQIIAQQLADLPNIHILHYTDMTIDLCHREHAQVIIRGIRGPEDLAYEQNIATVNRTLDPTIETLLVMADADHRHISSTIERERLLHLPTT